jgi:predicted nucleotidyltransferase
MSWYKQSMPMIRDIQPFISTICAEIKTLPGVKDVYIYGSYADHSLDPNYVVKDIDIIASTGFDSGDLLAIDNSKYSALRIHPNELEDEGFNPKAVSFTKRFLSYAQYNVDHWAASSDGLLLHWGAIPDNQGEWMELHAEAEADAVKLTGVARNELRACAEDKRKEWKLAYDHYLKKFLAKGATGWFASKTELNDVLSKAKIA